MSMMPRTLSLPTTLAGGELRRQFLDLVDMMSALRRLLREAAQAQTETELLRHAIQGLGEHVRMESCTLFLAEGGEFQPVIRYGQFGEAAGGMEMNPGIEPFPLDAGLLGEVYARGEAIFRLDCDQSPEDKRLCLLHGGGAGNALLSLPLMQGDRVLGVMNILFRYPNQLDAWHHNAFALYADALAQTLSNFRMITDLDAQVDRRTQLLRKSLDEAQSLRRRFERLSSIDEMTGLYNRRHFFERARVEVSRCQRQQGTLSLVLLDIDHFKQINDTWGHTVGDQVLVAVADALRRATREQDLAARVGGEEFVILLPDTPVEGVTPVLERLRQGMASLSIVQASGMQPLRASAGVTQMQPAMLQMPPEEVVDQLYLQADRAMYYCKTHGRDCWKVYDDTLPEIIDSGRP